MLFTYLQGFLKLFPDKNNLQRGVLSEIFVKFGHAVSKI